MLRDRLPAATDDRGTSPTVGSVLLVGITVLLATTAGTQLLALAGGHQGAFATATVEYSADEERVTITWVSNANAEELLVRVLVDGDRRTVALDRVGDRTVVDGDGMTLSAGNVGHWDDPSLSDGDRVTVTVLAVDGNETVVVADRSETV